MSPELARAQRIIREAAERGVERAAQHILAVSNAHVPIDPDLALERSSRVTADGLSATISYDEPYAIIQHERLDYHHDAGRTAKFLENAANSEKAAALETVAAELRAAIGG